MEMALTPANGNAMRAARKLVLAASYWRFAPNRTSPRLNRYFEFFVGPALLYLDPKFERATGNKFSRVGTLEDDAPKCFLFFK